MKYWKYLWYVIRHKWYVGGECRRQGFIFCGLFHDWSKLLPSEFFPYAEHFYGMKKNCSMCEHLVIAGNQCDINYSSMGNGEQADNCKDYIKKGSRDKTGYYKPTDTGDPDFDFAWLLHQKRNKHHWQWWILPEDNGGTKVLEIDEVYIREMYCDWVGASLAQGHGGRSGVVEWYEANRDKITFGSETRKHIEQLVYKKMTTGK